MTEEKAPESLRFTAPSAPRRNARTAPLTLEEVRAKYAPPRTLGCTEEARLAMDSALDAGGVYTLLQHSMEMGQMPMPSFMGYGALQAIAQDGLVRACVSTVADDMTREWVEIQSEGAAPKEADGGAGEGLLPRLASSMESLQVQKVFHEAAELAGYEGGAMVFIDTGEQNLSLPLNITPMSRELRPGGHLRFVAIDPVNIFPGNYNSTNPLRPDYYKPAFWWVLGTQVHSSRLLRIVANEVPVLLKPSFNFFGLPQAQILWDYVLHFQECRTAVARLLTKFSLTVFKTKMFEGTRFGMTQAGHLDQRIRYMVNSQNNDGVLAVDIDSEDVVKVETSLGGCVDIVRQALEFLAAINRTPAVKLLGISPSGFNATGESDLRNYYDHIAAMQKKILAHPLKVVLDCLQLHVAGRIDPSLRIAFRPLNEEDKASLASLRKTMVDTLAVLLDRDVVSTEEARRRLSDDPDSGFSDLVPDEIPEPSVTPADIEALPDYTGTEAKNPAMQKIGEAQSALAKGGAEATANAPASSTSGRTAPATAERPPSGTASVSPSAEAAPSKAPDSFAGRTADPATASPAVRPTTPPSGIPGPATAPAGPIPKIAPSPSFPQAGRPAGPQAQPNGTPAPPAETVRPLAGRNPAQSARPILPRPPMRTPGLSGREEARDG